MKLYLSSYRTGNSAEELTKWLAENGEDILVIPNAVDVFPDGERKTAGITDKCQDLEALGFNPRVLDLRKYFGNKEGLINAIGTCKAFYAIGGNVFVLRTAMKLSGFDEYLKDILETDVLYAGFSAGMCVLAKDLHGIHLVDDAGADPYGYGKVIWDGVGLIDYLPVPHYDSPNHPESHLMYDVVKYMQENNLPYKTLKDGDVIIESINEKKLGK